MTHETDPPSTVPDALAARRSVRAFTAEGVSPTAVEELLREAGQAPSGNNTQPWTVDVLTGPAKQRLTDAILAVRDAQAGVPPPEYDYYPSVWPEPNLQRRREVGWALYDVLGIRRGDRGASEAHVRRNFDFFGAPVGLIVSCDRRLGASAYIDVGLFLQSLALAAVARGLATCMQAAFLPYHSIIRRQLGLTDMQKIICGLALGYQDNGHPANRLRPHRLPVAEFSRFHHD
jgi:nitroreductase